MKAVRIKKAMPTVLGVAPDGTLREYGPFEPGQIWYIPESVARIMIAHGWAEEV